MTSWDGWPILVDVLIAWSTSFKFTMKLDLRRLIDNLKISYRSVEVEWRTRPLSLYFGCHASYFGSHKLCDFMH
jgi:hypothetical protein